MTSTELEFLDAIFEGFLGAFGSTWMVTALIFVGIGALLLLIDFDILFALGFMSIPFVLFGVFNAFLYSYLAGFIVLVFAMILAFAITRIFLR